jgi:hypothetical protein
MAGPAGTGSADRRPGIAAALRPLVWPGTVMTLGAIGIGVAIVTGGAAAGPIQQMIDAGAAAS